MQALRASMKHTGAGIPERQFIMPDFLPARSDWSTAKSFSDQPMPLDKILRLMGPFLRSMGLPVAELDQITGIYSGRRVLPTLADLDQAPPEVRLDIWGLDGQGRSLSVCDAKLILCS